jgi:hypothetical protein
MAEDPAVLPTNQILNQLDPCKDLAEGPTNQREHGAVILPLLQSLFVPVGQAWPWGTTAVGDTKGQIEANLPRSYSEWIANKVNSIQILRAAHSTGHSQRPQGLYVSQDSGSPDVVANPIMIVTPGNILDPAGKTKKGATFVVDRFGTLPFANIQRLGLDTVITGDITMTHRGGSPTTGTYTVTIPTNLERDPITGTFDARTFKAAEGSEYFKGNETKNVYIQEFAERVAGRTEVACKKYILCKELGDTLEVEWLNVLIETPGSEYTRENLVIITCDTVVFWRCIINGISVIFTKNGRTQYYGARQVDAAQRQAIEAAFILSIRKEVINHNQAVIDTLQAVIDSLFPARGGPWLSGVTWSPVQHGHCVDFLKKVKLHLETMNKDIDLYFNALTNLEAAKALADRSHFQTPFVWYAGALHFKVITKVKYLVGVDKYAFPLITPTFFAKSRLNQAGGQRGGVTTRAQRLQRAQDMATTTNPRSWDAVLTEIVNERGLDKEGYVIDADILRGPINTHPVRIVGTIDRYDLTLWSQNAGTFAADLNRTPYFFYLYIRDYHPEIFTYAIQVSAALGEASLSLLPGIEEYPIEYTIRENDSFKITPGAGVPSSESLMRSTLLAVALAIPFVDAFPSLQTESLMDFLTLFRTSGSGSLGAALPRIQPGLVEAAYPGRMEGGGDTKKEVSVDEVLSDAMDFYELYYAYKIRAIYQDRDLTQRELDRIYGKKDLPLSPLTKKLQQTSRPWAPQKAKKILPEIIRNRPNEPFHRVLAFGGKRYGKTKKRKASNQQKRKTRRSSTKRM